MSWKKCNQEAMSWKRIERDRSDGEGQGTVMLQKETLPQHNSLVVGDAGYVNVMRVLRRAHNVPWRDILHNISLGNPVYRDLAGQYGGDTLPCADKINLT